VCYPPTQTAPGERHSSLISISLLSPILVLRIGNGDPLVTVSLTFTVSWCLADVEFSIAFWERGLAEAAERLEQIYLHDYLTARAAGSLKVWFKPDNFRQLGGKSPGRASA